MIFQSGLRPSLIMVLLLVSGVATAGCVTTDGGPAAKGEAPESSDEGAASEDPPYRFGMGIGTERDFLEPNVTMPPEVLDRLEAMLAQFQKESGCDRHEIDWWPVETVHNLLLLCGRGRDRAKAVTDGFDSFDAEHARVTQKWREALVALQEIRGASTVWEAEFVSTFVYQAAKLASQLELAKVQAKHNDTTGYYGLYSVEHMVEQSLILKRAVISHLSLCTPTNEDPFGPVVAWRDRLQSTVLSFEPENDYSPGIGFILGTTLPHANHTIEFNLTAAAPRMASVMELKYQDFVLANAELYPTYEEGVFLRNRLIENATTLGRVEMIVGTTQFIEELWYEPHPRQAAQILAVSQVDRDWSSIICEE